MIQWYASPYTDGCAEIGCIFPIHLYRSFLHFSFLWKDNMDSTSNTAPGRVFYIQNSLYNLGNAQFGPALPDPRIRDTFCTPITFRLAHPQCFFWWGGKEKLCSHSICFSKTLLPPLLSHIQARTHAHT